GGLRAGASRPGLAAPSAGPPLLGRWGVLARVQCPRSFNVLLLRDIWGGSILRLPSVAGRRSWTGSRWPGCRGSSCSARHGPNRGGSALALETPEGARQAVAGERASGRQRPPV